MKEPQGPRSPLGKTTSSLLNASSWFPLWPKRQYSLPNHRLIGDDGNEKGLTIPPRGLGTSSSLSFLAVCLDVSAILGLKGTYERTTPLP